MGNVEYFEKITYKPKYHLGDRVRGLYNKIPFSGSVAVDHCPYVGQEPTVKVFLDLPLIVDGTHRTLITVKHGDLYRLV